MKVFYKLPEQLTPEDISLGKKDCGKWWNEIHHDPESPVYFEVCRLADGNMAVNPTFAGYNGQKHAEEAKGLLEAVLASCVTAQDTVYHNRMYSELWVSLDLWGRCALYAALKQIEKSRK